MWLKRALTDRARHINNIKRLDQLYNFLAELKDMGVACQSCAFINLSKILNNSLVRGREKIKEKLEEALIGPMNQKIVLDAPWKFMQLIKEAMQLVQIEIEKEQSKYKK